MERRRQQQQRIKQQQRFCVSQQDLTQAITRMKSIDHRSRRRATQDDLLHISSSSSCTSSSVETLTKLSVSQLIKEFEARSTEITMTPYASAQEILPNVINDVVVVNGAESNCCHMSVQTMKIKVNENDTKSNNSVCSPISRCSIDDGDQTVTVTNQQQHIEDKEQETTTKQNEEEEGEEEEEQQQSLPDNDRHKGDLPSSTSPSFHSIENCSCTSSTTHMLTRSTDIDAAAAATAQHDARFNDLLAKEAQLNSALADLISISNDGDVSSSMTSSSRSLTPNQPRLRNSNPTSKDNSLSASIALLNNLLETFDIDENNIDKKNNVEKNRDREISIDEHVKPINMFCLMLSDNLCANCHQSFAINEQIVNAAGQIWHTHCFVCAQCFQPFDNGIYFEHENRKYCERDFQMLFAPCCAECKQAIVGRVIRALQKCFHPDCFRCQSCHVPLLETGFSKHNNRALCRDCHANEKTKDTFSSNSVQQVCSKCPQMITDNRCLKYKGEFCHAYHFQCTSCRNELDENAREVRSSLYCVSCYNGLDLPVCAACRCLIDDRVVSALGKQWHVEHFCCARCAQPFRGSRHFENKGLAYCEADYHLLFGSTCFVCNSIITEGAYTACNKKYCADHFACSICEMKMNEKSKFFDVDARPVCKQCFGKLPPDIRKSLQQQQQQQQKKKQSSCIFETTTKKQTSI